MKRKIYQIELTDANGVLHIPYKLFSWQVFKTKENAEKWAKENFYDSEKEMDMVIKEYNEDDIDDYFFVDDVEIIENEIYFVDKEFFGDEDEHCYNVHCQDGHAKAYRDESEEIGSDILMLSYPTLSEILADEDMINEVLQYRGLHDLSKEDITYGDIMVCYGKIYANFTLKQK